MQLISVIRKAHIADKDTVAHLRFAGCIGIEQKVLSIYIKEFFGQLRAPLATLYYLELRACFIALARVGVVSQGEGSFWHLAYLPGPLHCLYACHCFHTSKIGVSLRARKDESM